MNLMILIEFVYNLSNTQNKLDCGPQSQSVMNVLMQFMLVANLHLRRATTTTRAQAVSLNNLFYDRYLSCDSSYARRRR